MIDKEKLLKELPCSDGGWCRGKECKKYVIGVSITQCITNIAKNFPEEPAIDFDALYKEWDDLPMDTLGASSSFRNFLKSKNISVPVKRELPVKTIYTLKKEYQDVFKDFGFLHSTFDTHSYEPPPGELKKYYDRTDDVDYSVIPKGSVVEVRIKGEGGYFRKYHSINDGDGSINLYFCGESDCTFKLNKDDFIRVVEWAKEVIK